MGCGASSQRSNSPNQPYPAGPTPGGNGNTCTRDSFPLPQNVCGSLASHRTNEIAKQAEDYKWHYAFGTSVPPVVVTVPSREKDRAAHWHKLGITFDLLANMARLRLNTTADAVLEKLKCEHDKPFQDYTDAINRATDLVVPECAPHWMTDREYGWQRLNGVNPTLIRCLTELPAKFPVGRDSGVEQVLKSRGEPSFSELLSTRRIFVCDYELLDDLDTPEGRVHLAPLLCLYLDKEDHMMPLAIQLGQAPGGAGESEYLMFSPADPPNVWLAAKTHVATAEAQQHEVVAHLVSTHLIMEAAYVAAMQTMHVSHPVVEFLQPHFWFTVIVNGLAREQLINKGGPIDQDFNMGFEGVVQLLGKSCKDWHWKRFDIPLSIERRDMAWTPGRLSEFYWRDDALSLWDIMAKYVERVMAIFYQTDKDVEDDRELHTWLDRLMADEEKMQGCGYHGLPGYDEKAKGKNNMTTREELNRLLTMIIFNVSAGHAAVNNGQYAFMGYVPNMPVTFRLPVSRLNEAKRSGNDFSLSDLDAHMPKKEHLLRQIATVASLSADTQDVLGSYDPEKFFPGRGDVWGAVHEFKSDLATLTQAISRRNGAPGVYRGYRFLDPPQIAQGVSV